MEEITQQKGQSIYKSIYNIQSEIGALEKTETNPFFTSKYININGVLTAVQPYLEKNKLVLLRPINISDDKIKIETIIKSIENDEELKTESIIPWDADPQKVGSIITYYRRYALISLLGLYTADQEDDDANKAVNKTQQANQETTDFL